MKKETYAGLARAMAAGAGFSIAAMAALCIVAAALIKRQLLPEQGLTVCAVAICVLGMIPGCMLAQKLAGRARLPVCLGCCALTLAVFAAIRLALGGGKTTWYTLPAAVLSALGCALAGAGRAR